MDKKALDNHADQINPNNPKYQEGSPRYTGPQDKHVLDNKSDLQNPNNEKYAKAREGNQSPQK